MGIYGSTMTSKGQTTIPAEIRHHFQIKPGDRIRYVVDGDKIHLRIMNKKLSDLAGILGRPPNGRSLSIEDMDDAIGDALAEDDRRIMDDWNRHQRSLAADDPGRSDPE